MTLTWERENPAVWDAAKARIVGGAPSGLFVTLRSSVDGVLLPGEWWRVDRDGEPVGYGWMDVTWGDAEILLAVDPQAQRHGVGTFVLDRLDEEAARQGVRYLYNVVPAGHPDPARLTSWLEGRGFVASGEGGLLRRQVSRS